MTYFNKDNATPPPTPLPFDTESSRQDQACQWLIENDLSTLPDEENSDFQKWLNQDSRNLGAYIRAHVHFESLNYIRTAPPPACTQQSPPPLARRAFLSQAMVAGVAGLGLLLQPDMTTADDGTFLLKNSKLLPRHVLLEQDEVVLDVKTEAHSKHVTKRMIADIVTGRMGVKVKNGLQLHAQNMVFKGDCLDCDVVLTHNSLEVALYNGALTWHHATQRGASQSPSLLTFRQDPTKGLIAKSLNLTAQDIQKHKAWRYNQAIFDRTSLAEAAAILNHYTTRPVYIASKRLAQAHVSGTFGFGMPEDFAQAVCTLFKCHQHPTAQNIILADA